MKKHLLFAVLTFISLAVGFSSETGKALELGDRSLYAHEEHDHTTPDHDHSGITSEDDHPHGTVEVAADQPTPIIGLVVHPDAQQGWNLEVQVENFTFAPEHINQPGSTTEGHAHLYVDGVKITRLYGNWYYLESLTSGRHEITVSLNTNDHKTLVHHGQSIQSTAILDVP